MHQSTRSHREVREAQLIATLEAAILHFQGHPRKVDSLSGL